MRGIRKAEQYLRKIAPILKRNFSFFSDQRR